MWGRQYSPRTRQMGLLVLQVIVMLICVGYIQYFYVVGILPDTQVKSTFSSTSCFIMNKKLSKKGKLLSLYRATFLVRYTVKDIQYSRWISGNGLDSGFTSSLNGEQSIVDQYDIGGTYTCWFNPRDPQQVVLVMRHSWIAVLPLIIPAIIGFIMLLYFLTTLLRLLGIISTKNPHGE